MMQRIRKTRAGRKLLANRMALGAMLIIGVYLAAAIFVMLGGISPSFCNQPVGPPNIPGFFAEAPAEKRLVNAENTLAVVDRALAKSTPESPQASLDEIQVGLRKLEKISLDDFELKLEKAYAIYDDLSASPDLENDESGLALLADLESEVESLTATPTFSQHGDHLPFAGDRSPRTIHFHPGRILHQSRRPDRCRHGHEQCSDWKRARRSGWLLWRLGGSRGHLALLHLLVDSQLGSSGSAGLRFFIHQR